MADNTEFDPGAAFREAVTNWERQYSEAANKMMGSEGFSSWMNEAQKNQMSMQKAATDFMAQQLHSMNLPTLEDITVLGEAIRKIDHRLENIEQQLRTLETKPGFGAANEELPTVDENRPPRTKQAPTGPQG